LHRNALNASIAGGIESLIMMDMSADMVKKWRESENGTGDGPETHFVIGDEEFLPIKAR
jgi:NADH dehydrogenase [ubiquinone] 1 alpha subcomplex assembly factor 5